MKNLKHVVLSNQELSGFEYGMLRDFEDEVIRLTGGDLVAMPKRQLPKFIEHRIGHGTRYSGLRSWIPKSEYELKADVLWFVLMGPENFTLDLFKNWDRGVGIKILYLFDTFENQLPSIRRILQSTHWDLTITSFKGAVPFLEEHTQRKWYAVAQGVKLERFQPVTEAEKVINFCSYGRRLENVHNSIKHYCAQTKKYYDYTTAASIQSQLNPREYYGQYAWHLRHSFFTFSWPVELTHPKRVLTFSPITCRWFEAAASGTVIVGQAPKDPTFDKFFGSELVVPIDYEDSDESLNSKWEHLWNNRLHYLQSALKARELNVQNWSWESRVKEILNLIDSVN
jgi:hypothetical protein